jgi:hypothetical protein
VCPDVSHQGSRFARVHPGLLVSQFSRHVSARRFYIPPSRRNEEKFSGFSQALKRFCKSLVFRDFEKELQLSKRVGTINFKNCSKKDCQGAMIFLIPRKTSAPDI